MSDSLVFHGDRPLIPTWLATPGPVYIKRQVRTSKMDPLVDEVELLQANHPYAHVRYPDGRETTEATKHLAPNGSVVETLPAPEHIPEEAENLPVDTYVRVTPDAEPSSAPEPQPELTPVQNVELNPYGIGSVERESFLAIREAKR